MIDRVTVRGAPQAAGRHGLVHGTGIGARQSICTTMTAAGTVPAICDLIALVLIAPIQLDLAVDEQPAALPRKEGDRPKERHGKRDSAEVERVRNTEVVAADKSLGG